MSKTWVPNTGAKPQFIGGKLVHPGEGAFVDSPDPSAPVPVQVQSQVNGAGALELVAGGVKHRAMTPVQAAAFDAMVSGAGKSTFGWQRVQRSMPNPPSDVTGGVAKTIDNQVPAKRPYFGFRLTYMNLNTAAAANYPLVKAGGAANHLVSTGAEINWAQQFASGAGSVAVPPATVALKAGHIRPGFGTTDFCYQQSVARADYVSNGSRPLLRIRSRTAAESQFLWTLGGNANWNAFPGNGGMLYGSYVTNTDLVTTTNDSATVLANGGAAQPVIVQFGYYDPANQWWNYGDSRGQGDGSSVTAGAVGLAGWAILVHCQSSSVDVLDMSVSGQLTLDSIAIARSMLATIPDLPYGISITVYSPNDGAPTQALIDSVWGPLLELIRFANKLGVRVVLLSCAPVDNWTATQHGICETQNARALALANASPYWVRFLDMAAIVRDPFNSRAINPAYRIAGEAPGYTHWNDAGHQAVATPAATLMAA